MNPKTSKLQKTVDYLYRPETQIHAQSNAQLQAELRSFQVDPEALEIQVNRLLKSAAAPELPTAEPEWLRQAREKRRWFEGKIKEQSKKIAEKYKSAEELVGAMIAGDFGAGVQAKAGVFFRNQKASEISEKDLQTLIEDCQLLEVLENPKK